MSTALAACGVGRALLGACALLWAHAPFSFLNNLDELVPIVLAALVLLTIVTVVGHLLWLAASAVLRVLFGRPPRKKPLSPEQSPCVFCGGVIGRSDRQCANCGRDLLGTAAEESEDISAVFRQLKRWRRTGRISEAEQIRWRQWLEERRSELLLESRGGVAVPAPGRALAQDRPEQDDGFSPAGAPQEESEEIVVAEMVPDDEGFSLGEPSDVRQTAARCEVAGPKQGAAESLVSPVPPVPPVSPEARRPAGAPKRPVAPPLIAEPVAAVDSRPGARQTWVDWFSGFLEQRNIRWGEVIGAVLMVGSAVALVISLWQTLQEIRYFPFFFSAGLVATIFAAGLYAHRRWRLETTSCGLLGVASLLTPLAFVALAGPLYESAQPDYTALGLALAVAAGLAVLLERSATVLAPNLRGPLTWGVVGNSLWIVFSSVWPKNAGQPAWSAGWSDPYSMAAAVGSALFLSALGWAAARAVRRRLLRSEGASLLNALGLSVFALIVMHATLLARCESAAALAEALRLLAPLTTVGAGACLATAVAVHRAGRSGRESALVGILAQLVGYSSGAVMVLGIVAAWPQPADMLAVAAFNAVVLAAVAIRHRAPLLTIPAMLCAAWAALLLFHLWDGRPPLPWRLGPETAFEPKTQPRDLIGELRVELLLLPWRARSVLVWLGLQVVFLAAAEAVGRWRRAAVARWLERGAAVAMALCVAIGLFESLRFGPEAALCAAAALAAAMAAALAAVGGNDRSWAILHQVGLMAAAVGGVCLLAVDRGWATDPADLVRPICLHAFATAFGLLSLAWIAMEWLGRREDRFLQRLLGPKESSAARPRNLAGDQSQNLGDDQPQRLGDGPSWNLGEDQSPRLGSDRPPAVRTARPAIIEEIRPQGLISPPRDAWQMLARAPRILGDTPLARWLPHGVIAVAAVLCAAWIAAAAWVEWIEPYAAVNRWAADGSAAIRAEFFGWTALWPLAFWIVLLLARRAIRFGSLDAVALVLLVGMTAAAAAVWTGDPPAAGAAHASVDAPTAAGQPNDQSNQPSSQPGPSTVHLDEPSSQPGLSTVRLDQPSNHRDGANDPKSQGGDSLPRYRHPTLPAVMPAWAWSAGLGFAAWAAVGALWNDRRLAGRWLRRRSGYAEAQRIEIALWWSAALVLAVPSVATAFLVALRHLLGDPGTAVPPAVYRLFGGYFSVGVVAVPWALLAAGTAMAAWRWRNDSIGGVAGLLVQIGAVLGYLAQRVAVAADPFTWATAKNALLLAVAAGAVWCIVMVAAAWAALPRGKVRGPTGRTDSAVPIGFCAWTLLLFAMSLGVRVAMVLTDWGPVPVARLDIVAFAAVALASATVAARLGAGALAAVGYYAVLTALLMTMTARTDIGTLFVWKLCGALAAFVLAMALSGWVARRGLFSQWFTSLGFASQAADAETVAPERPTAGGAEPAEGDANGRGPSLGNGDWFTASQALWALVAAVSAAAVAWSPRFDLLTGAHGVPGFGGRFAGVGAALILAAAAAVMAWTAAGPHRLSWRVTAVAGVVFITTCFGWARLPVEPEAIEAAAPRLHRLVVVLLTTMLMSCMSWVVSRGRNRRPDWIAPWTEAARTALPGIAMTAAAVLALVLLGEFALWWNSGTVPMAAWASLTVTVALVAAAIAAVAWAVASRDRHRSPFDRKAAVYAAEAIIGVLGIHLYWSMPWLFTSGLVRQYWMAIVIVGAMVGAALAELFARRGWSVLSEPLERTAMLAPLAPALAFWGGQPWGAETYYLGGASPIIWFLMGGFYTVLAARRGSLWLSAAAVVTGTAGLWVLWHGFDWRFARHPQVWLIPPGIMLLAVERLQRGRLTEAGRASLRYLALTIIYGSSLVEFWRLVDTSLAPALITIGLCLAGVLLGIWLHLRSFLAVASGCLLLALARLLYYAAFEQGRMWLFWGCCLLAGAGMIALFALFERRREQFAAAVDRLRQWND